MAKERINEIKKSKKTFFVGELAVGGFMALAVNVAVAVAVGFICFGGSIHTCQEI